MKEEMKDSDSYETLWAAKRFENNDNILIAKILISILKRLEDIKERTPDDN